MKGAISPSATMTSMGQFDFLRDAGLAQDPAVTTLAVDSPFDFAQQGQLIAASTHADPRQADRFNAEMCTQLMADLQQVTSGALVLFTSLRAADASGIGPAPRAAAARWCKPSCRAASCSNSTASRGQGPAVHHLRYAVVWRRAALPGPLCESLFITKLPFAPPDEPVSEARAEWLRSIARDPFLELVVPATAVRLAQWMGRAIRTEADRAQVICYDKRLTGTSYGQRSKACRRSRWCGARRGEVPQLFASKKQTTQQYASQLPLE